jgi:hypothetical protein
VLDTDQISKMNREPEFRQRLLELQEHLSHVPPPVAAFVEESNIPQHLLSPSDSRSPPENAVSFPSPLGLLQQHSVAPSAADTSSAIFKFLIPKDYKMGLVSKAPIPVGGAAAGDCSVSSARKNARVAAIAKNLHLRASDVDCVAVRLFLSSPHLQTCCFIVKINGDATRKREPYPTDEREGHLYIGGRLYIVYASTHLCALQILLNKDVCFHSGRPVVLDEIGSAFIQIIVPSMFNHIKHHSESLFSVSSYVLRNMFAHMREQSFRHATNTGGILTATKLWFQEQHVFGNDESFWRPFDIAEYVFHGSHFAYVFPLCYRHIRECLRLHKESIAPRFLETVLQCIPASSPDIEIPSMLDWYFDHQGESCSLRVLMAINNVKELNSRLREGSPPPLAATEARGSKPGRHKTATENGFYRTFVSCLHRFFNMVQALKLQKTKAGFSSSKDVFFCKDASFSIDSTASPEQGLVWLGLGKEVAIYETGQKFCKPVAIKSHRNVDPDIFARMMQQMKPGSFIASAQEMYLHVYGLNGEVTAPSPRTCRHVDPSNETFLDSACFFSAGSGTALHEECGAVDSDRISNSNHYWVSEAGICTLHELFENGVLDEERGTQSHRRLVKEVCFVSSPASSDTRVLCIQGFITHHLLY